MIATLIVSGLLLTAPLANPSLDECRTLEAEFDYQGMVAACSVAAADPNATREERILSARLLGIAHTAMGDEQAARIWFIRLLTLDPEHELPKEISPRFRATFAQAMEAFARDGGVSVTHTAPTADEALAGGPLNLRFEVVDPLSRVTRAVVEVAVVHGDVAGSPQQFPLSRSIGSGAGEVVFEGALPDPGVGAAGVPASYALSYRLVLQNVVGDEVVPDPALEPVSLPRTQAESGSVGGAEDEGAGGAILWASVAAVGGVVAVTAVAGGVAAALCVTVGCGNTDTPAPTGYVRIEIETPAGQTP